MVERIAVLNPLLLAALLVAQNIEDDPAVRCQEALLQRKVIRGEFPEKILEQAMTLPLKEPVIVVDKPAIRRLLGQLGSDDFKERQTATDELMQKHYAPRFLSVLLKEVDDPEVRFRAGSVLAHWKAHPPKDLQEKALARNKVKMWYNLPACLAKLKTYRIAHELTSKHKLDYQMLYDVCRGIRLGDFEPEVRREALLTSLTRMPETSHFFPQQMTREEWNDTDLLNTIRDRLGDEKARFDPILFEQLLWHLPPEVDLEDWRGTLATSKGRKGAIAALMVKTGNRTALPEFISLLNQEWSTVNVRDGDIRGGGHRMFFSPFYDFKLLDLPAYRRFAPEILAGIADKFDDKRIAIHKAYLNAVRPFADTEAGQKLLKRLSTHACPQTALAAAAMISDPAALAAAAKKASESDLSNTWHEITDALRTLRARTLLDPAERARGREAIGTILECAVEHASPETMEDVASFIHEELAPFDLPGANREKVIQMLTGFRGMSLNSIPSDGVRFLVEDARKRGDLPRLTQLLKARADAPGAAPETVALYLSFLMLSGPKEAFAPFVKKKILGRLGDKNVPFPFTNAAWIVDPEAMMNATPFNTFHYAAQYFLLNPGLVDLEKVARKMKAGGREDKAWLLRLSCHLEGANFDAYEPTVDGTVSRIFCEMAWNQPPTAAAIKKKFLKHCERMHATASDYAVSEFVDHAPALLKRFDFELREEELNDPVAVRVAAEAAFRKGDSALYRRLIRKFGAMPGHGVRYSIRDGFDQRRMILDLARGRLDGVTPGRLRDSSHHDAYRLTNLLYENGFAKEAARFRAIAREPREFSRWDYAECLLVWAWNEAMAGNLEEALRLSDRALTMARSREMSDYTLILRRWLKEKSPEFAKFLDILRLRRPFDRRARCQEGMAAFAAGAADADLKALSAFLAARMARALGKDPEGLWRTGAAARGLHSRYCQHALDALPEEKEEFSITSNWYDRDPMGPTFTPFTACLGICYKAKQAFLVTPHIAWIGPYGIPSNVERSFYFYNGSGWWVYIGDEGQAKAWVPGEWTIVIDHANGVEYHQRTLLPYRVR